MKIKVVFVSFCLIIVLIGQISCNYGEKARKKSAAVSSISFDSDSISLGIIPDNIVVKHTIRFQNTSNVPLLIKGVKGTCGCTTISYPKGEIINKDSIIFSFDPTGQEEHSTKSLFVYSNTIPEVTEIKFTATIKK